MDATKLFKNGTKIAYKVTEKKKKNGTLKNDCVQNH